MTRLVTIAAFAVGLAPALTAAHAQTARLIHLSDDSGTSPEFAIVPAAPSGGGEPSAPAAPALVPNAAPTEPTLASIATSGEPLAQTQVLQESASLDFASAGSDWWSFGGGGAVGRNTHIDGNIYGAWSHFIADDVEFATELGVWYYSQEGDDAAGINPNIVFRWHFVHEEDFTVYADIGIGVLLATDNVPSDGTSFDFTPRAGVGATIALNDRGDERLIVGLRWAHVSNARIQGDDDNPGLDSIMLYSGFQFPF